MGAGFSAFWGIENGEFMATMTKGERLMRLAYVLDLDIRELNDDSIVILDRTGTPLFIVVFTASKRALSSVILDPDTEKANREYTYNDAMEIMVKRVKELEKND